MGWFNTGMTALNFTPVIGETKKYTKQMKQQRNSVEKAMPPKIASDFAGAVGMGLAFAGTGLGATMLAKGVGSIHNNFKANRMFDVLKRKYPKIRTNEKKSREYFDMIVAYAPGLLRHERAIGDFLERQMEYPASSIEFIKQLADIEASLVKGQGRAPEQFGQTAAQTGAGFMMRGD